MIAGVLRRKIRKLCRERNINQAFTAAGNPEYNDLAERGLAVIESSALPTEIQAPELFKGLTLPNDRRCEQRRRAGLVMRATGLQQ